MNNTCLRLLKREADQGFGERERGKERRRFRCSLGGVHTFLLRMATSLFSPEAFCIFYSRTTVTALYSNALS